MAAAATLADEGIDAEVIDLRSLKPWDQEMVIESVRKTGRAVVADPGWRTAGASAEIAATIAAKGVRPLERAGGAGDAARRASAGEPAPRSMRIIIGARGDRPRERARRSEACTVAPRLEERRSA